MLEWQDSDACGIFRFGEMAPWNYRLRPMLKGLPCKPGDGSGPNLLLAEPREASLQRMVNSAVKMGAIIHCDLHTLCKSIPLAMRDELKPAARAKRESPVCTLPNRRTD